MKSVIFISAVIFLFTGCTKVDNPGTELFSSFREIESPAGVNSGQPYVFAGNDGLFYMSWIEPGNEKKHVFRFTTFDGHNWDEPAGIAQGDHFFVNWADVPSIFLSEDNRLAAHWLESSGEWIFAYDVRMSLSGDRGMSWSDPVTPHRDSTKSEHGFASFFNHPDGGIGFVWLDGREAEYAGAAGNGHASDAGWNMHLRSTIIKPDKTIGEELLLDRRVCECCPTAATETDSGVLIAYRDRTEDEIRDISLVRYENGLWSDPYPLYNDGWNIPGCPVNGPALSANGSDVAAAWYTAADNDARVNVAFSNDGGETFGEPVRVDDGLPSGRVAVELLDDGSAIVMWIEIMEEDAALMVRRVNSDRSTGTLEKIAVISDDRSSGYPRMARIQDMMLFAWVDSFNENRIRTAIARLPE